MKTFYFLLIFISGNYLLAQSNTPNLKPHFQQTGIEKSLPSGINYYPLSDGDYWEFIETDTAAVAGQFYNGMNFSVTKKIISDTLLSNGIIYKKIRWKNEANSVSYPPVLEFNRKDSIGNVYLFYQNNDHLLFDVTAGTGYTYTAHMPGYVWQIAARYNVIGFGDTLSAIDFNLLENGLILRETYTLVQNFGTIYYKKNHTGYDLPEGYFWGAVIDSIKYGELVVNTEVNWSEYYPLHVGDYWVYDGISGSIPFIETHRITGDTVMTDGELYFIRDNFIIERLDSNGHYYVWSDQLQSGIIEYKFTAVIGDTGLNNNIQSSFWRLNNKFFNYGRYELYRFLYPDLIYLGEYYDQGLGLYEWSIEGGRGILKGAYINGSLFGDTTTTNVSEYSYDIPEEFILYQNYPNPFNSSTTICFYLSKPSDIELKLVDMLGEEIITLAKGYFHQGINKISFNASNLSSGIYICVLITSNKIFSNKVILLK